MVFDEETRAASRNWGKRSSLITENHRFRFHPTHTGAKGHTPPTWARIQEGCAIETANPTSSTASLGCPWTNKDRLSDAMRDRSSTSARSTRVSPIFPKTNPARLRVFIKKFADDAGHTAAEFYTNRTVVHLMTEMLERSQ